MIETYVRGSKTIRLIGLDQERNVLLVEFIHGGKYEYPCEVFQVYQDFCDAKSKGAYFHKRIRPLGGTKLT